MLAKVRSCAVIGLEGALIEVEVDLSNGLAGFMIVGLPDLPLRSSMALSFSQEKQISRRDLL